MSHCDEFLAFKVEEENEDAQDGQHLERAQLSKAEMGMAKFPSSTIDNVHLEDTLGEVAAARVLNNVKGPQHSPVMAREFPVSMVEKLESYLQGGSARRQEKKKVDGREESAQVGASLQKELENKMSNLVGFLLFMYRTKQLTTKEVMLRTVLNNDENFSFILSQVSECMRVIFGIDVEKVDPQAHSYTVVTILGLTYNGLVGPQQTMPNTGLLVMVLGVIIMADDCISEQAMWEKLSLLGVFPGKKHVIYREPRELLTNVWVQEQYQEYQREPGSYPPCYEFLWGLRAHIETNELEVLVFLLKI